ncbi:MAG: cation diffusion facilitator family transporter [Solirubrobacterales bacterium]|nr:cation diffusion facilitator family transporter [Solirubrobacterales bacterium]MCB8971054.1 cation diffusion facilitator family transporter [Thermoleophilales bacterium]MCO5326052.1 cation diffusion facilitator family transporter [Solirubrobacterales bacterium]
MSEAAAADAHGGHGESAGAILAAFLANIGIAATKFIGFLITGSSSLLAESIHSVADSSNQGLLVLGGKRAEKAPTELHPYGFGRSRYFWSFVVAIVLFSAGGLFALYEGWHKISHPEEISSPAVAIVILVLAMCFEGFALRTALKHARPARGKLSVPQFVHRSRSPELPVLLVEDSAALCGLSFALLGVVLATITGEPVFDGIGTLMIGALLVVVGIFLAIEMQSLLLGEAATEEHQEAIEEAAGSVPEIATLVYVMTQHLSPDDLLVAIKVEFAEGLSAADAADVINAAEAKIRAAVPIATRIYIEPAAIADRPAAPAAE